MERREFLAGAGALALGGAIQAAQDKGGLRLAMNQATSMSADFRAAMEGYARAGFRYVEPWITKIDEFAARESLAVARRILGDHALTPVCACAQGGIVEPLPASEQAKSFDQLKHKLEVCAELGIPRLVVHSVGRDKYTAADYDPAAERLRKAADMAQPLRAVIVFEFIRGTAFCGSLSTSVHILRKANHPNARMLIDLFHFWGGFSKFEDLELLKDGEPEHVHIDDLPAGVPREILTDRDRVPPGEGVVPIGKILRVLRQKKYQGAFSIELFDPRLQKGDPYEVALQLKRAAERVLRQV
jgi:4-hydroxyphenylpyruvate dioxygenase